MAMRITTKMMQSTSLRNLTTNKMRQEKLTNQLSTGKKITKPSDDPVVAIRSLKLNSTLDKIDQYYEKNASDAESWLELTMSSLESVNTILTGDGGIRKSVIQIQNNYMNAEDREAVIKNIRQAVEEIYSIGNSDSGGRSIFTGYRTDMSLFLKADKTEKNVITEQLTNQDIKKKTFVRTGDLKSINEGNFTTIDTKEYDVNSKDVYVIRAAYGDLDVRQKVDTAGNPLKDAGGNPVYEADIELSFMKDAKTEGNSAKLVTGAETDNPVSAYVSINTVQIPAKAVFNVTWKQEDGTIVTEKYHVTPGSSVDKDSARDPEDAPQNLNLPAGIKLSYGKDGTFKIEDSRLGVVVPAETVTIGSNVTKDANGSKVATFDEKFKTSLEISDYFPTGTDEAYLSAIGDTNKNNVTFIASTGEFLLGENVQKRLSELSNDTEVRVTYGKSEWKRNDLDPVHYFYTERTMRGADGKEKVVNYNEQFLTNPGADGRQIIEYDIGNNQTIRVNTTADEAFTHDMIRDAEEIVLMLEDYGTLAARKKDVENMIASEKYSGAELTKLEEHLKAINESLTRYGSKINKRCQDLIDDTDGYFKRTQLAETEAGARGSRLLLIQNRLEMQQTNFGELVSENEDADYTDMVIQLKSIEMTYQAALSSISYVMQTSLLDFIR